MPEPSMSSDAIRQRLTDAWAELQRVVQDKHVRLSLPFNHRYDTDLVIGAALNDTDYLLRESDARLPYIKKLEWRNRHLQETLDRIAEIVQEQQHWDWDQYQGDKYMELLDSLEALIVAVTEPPKPQG